MRRRAAQRRQWSLLSSHGQVLMLIWREPNATVRRYSDLLNFSERRIMGVLRDLELAGLIRRGRRGRQNSYTINLDAHLRAPAASRITVRTFLESLDMDMELPAPTDDE